MSTDVLFERCGESHDFQGNARTGAILNAFSVMGKHLSAQGLEELRSQVAGASVKGWEEITQVFEIWHRASLIECDPELAEWADQVEAMVLEGTDEEGLGVDDLLAQYR